MAGSNPYPFMKNLPRWLIVGVVLAAVGGVMALRQHRRAETADAQNAVPDRTAPASVPLPRLVDLGANHCVPCRMMAPILEEPAVTFLGRLIVEVIDLTRDTEAGARYRVSVIPTRLFFAPEGRELYRHEGFMPGEDILARWREPGFDLEKPGVGDEGDHASGAAPAPEG